LNLLFRHPGRKSNFCRGLGGNKNRRNRKNPGGSEKENRRETLRIFIHIFIIRGGPRFLDIARGKKRPFPITRRSLTMLLHSFFSPAYRVRRKKGKPYLGRANRRTIIEKG
jgi:hypothetical protein